MLSTVLVEADDAELIQARVSIPATHVVVQVTQCNTTRHSVTTIGHQQCSKDICCHRKELGFMMGTETAEQLWRPIVDLIVLPVGLDYQNP